MDKIKGWTAERKIDKLLNVFKKKKYMPGIRRLIEAKTLIMSLRKENKDLMIKLDEAIQNKEFWKHESLEAEKQNKEMFKQHQDYFVENERLKQSEIEAKEIISELESKLEEYKRFGLDKDLKELEKLK